MNLGHLLGFSLLCYVGTAVAQRQIHGVNGYYNWTPAQLEIGAKMEFGNEGTAVKNEDYRRSYVVDGDYIRSYLGVHNTNYEPEKGGFLMRNRFDIKEKIAGEGLMTITPAFPVLALKASTIKNSESKAEGGTKDKGSFWVEMRWYSPYEGGTSVKENFGDAYGGMWGFNQKSMDIFACQFAWGEKDALGRDSLELKYNGDWNRLTGTPDSTWAILANGDKQAKKEDTTYLAHRIPVSFDEDKSDVVMAWNFAAIKDTATAERLESMRLLERLGSFKLQSIYLCYICRADTLKNIIYDAENPSSIVSADPKNKEDMPYVDIKWLKTFRSMAEFKESLTAENNWGDGEKVNPQKDVLNTVLWEAEKVIKGFQNYMGDADNAYASLKEIHAKADGVYNKVDATTEEYLAAIEEVNAAVAEFYSFVNPTEDLVYNYIRTSDGSVSLYALSDEVTKDSYTGRPLALGANESAMPLTFVPVGENNGLVTYNLKGKDGVVVQCTDGTLLLVNGASDAASFTFADRDGFGLFDMQCGSYYYYKSGYELKTVDEFPDTDYEGMQPYLFQIEDALSSYVPSDDEKTGLFEAWEFNGEAEDDPGTKGTINGAELVMGEHGQTFMLDGWRMQRWRMWSRVNKDTYKDAEGEDLQCLKLTVADTYDSFDGTSLGNVTTYPTSPSMRREGGVFTNFYDRDPEGGVRDESCMISLNPGVRRYIAMKCKGTNPEITVDKFNFLQQVNGLNSEFALNLSDAEMKGDVYYWDLLRYVSVGKTNYVSQYMSTQGFQQGDALYIDWIRTYETVDDIPSESFATGVRDVQADGGDLKVFVTGRTINVFTSESGAIYTVDGTCVSEFEGTVHETVRPGIYIVRAGAAVKKVIVR